MTEAFKVHLYISNLTVKVLKLPVYKHRLHVIIDCRRELDLKQVKDLVDCSFSFLLINDEQLLRSQLSDGCLTVIQRDWLWEAERHHSCVVHISHNWLKLIVALNNGHVLNDGATKV